LIQDLTKPEVVAFIHDHERSDVNDILLKYKFVHGVPVGLVADQIKGRQKAKTKLPTFYKQPNVIYPPVLNLEQSSSEETGKFKARYLQTRLLNNSNQLGADLTGGFGVDAFFLSSVFENFHYVEPNVSLLEIAKHNLGELGILNTTFFTQFVNEYLKSQEAKSDFFYLDPSRRLKDKKVFTLADCEPNIIDLQEKLFDFANNILIKTSPLLDLQQGIKEIKFVKEVVVLAVDNECREVLFFCEKNFNEEPSIKAVNLTKDLAEEFDFTFTEERETELEYSAPLAYLFEPNAAILKAGAFKSITKKFDIRKIEKSTHLYTAQDEIRSFPGRVFKINAVVKPDAKSIKEFLPEGKANVTTRNYPLSVDELKKKTSIKDGGEKYLIGFSGTNKKFLVVADRVK
jgi:hypothetical protein